MFTFLLLQLLSPHIIFIRFEGLHIVEIFSFQKFYLNSFMSTFIYPILSVTIKIQDIKLINNINMKSTYLINIYVCHP